MARYVLEIFLSSTSEDLRDHRRAIAEALDSFGQLSVRMESFGAKPTAPLEVCREQVRRCDALIVVVGHRYGWVPTEAEGGDGLKSITWWEVYWALEAKKPVYAFLVDPNASWTGPREQDALLSASTEADGLAVWRAVGGLRRFRTFLDGRTTRAYFRNINQLGALVTTSLVQWVVDHEVAQAKALVEQESLPAPRPRSSIVDIPAPEFSLTSTKDQAVIVGSDVVVFAKEVSAEQRQDIVNASLLAQLVARKKVPRTDNPDEVRAWYDGSFQVQASIGWVIQDKAFAEYRGDEPVFEMQEALIEVAKTTLAGAPGTLALVLKTLQCLKSMSADSPWITLFNRESQSATTARFQVIVVEPDSTGQLLAHTMAFGLAAKRKVTQVLFFKFNERESSLHHNYGTVTINSSVLEAIRPEMRTKLQRHIDSNVAGFDV